MGVTGKMNKRELKLESYGISSKRYKELCGFCEQYPEWKQELESQMNTLKSPQISDMPVYHDNSDATANLALKRAEMDSNCVVIEETARIACKELSAYIIKSVCYEEPFWYLRDIMQIPCGQSTFYDMRRYFFFLLDQNKRKMDLGIKVV